MNHPGDLLNGPSKTVICTFNRLNKDISDIMVERQAFSAAVPLIYIVILELSTVSRRTNISEILDRSIGIFTSPLFNRRIPLLRRVMIIHLMNSSLFIVALFIIYQLGSFSSSTATLLWFVTWLMWLFLPYLEIQEYGSLPVNQTIILSESREVETKPLHRSVKNRMKYTFPVPIFIFLINYIPDSVVDVHVFWTVTSSTLMIPILWTVIIYLIFEDTTVLIRGVVAEVTTYKKAKEKATE